MIDRYAFCVEDSDYYERPDILAQSRHFAQHPSVQRGRFVALDAPEGWNRTETDEWISYSPEVRMPRQGWKIHVSATMANCDRILTCVAEVCFEEHASFKFVPDKPALLARNKKYAARASSGKFITIYPVDDAQLERLLVLLDDRIGGCDGPYILSDLRWRGGPLFVRYGGFEYVECEDATGDIVPAIRKPDGTLVPDAREPEFVLPDFAHRPEFLRRLIDERLGNAPQDDDYQFPYSVERALHFSNSGGVYLAAPIGESNNKLVLKEARPFAGVDSSLATALDRLRNEAEMLQVLDSIPEVPDFVDMFRGWEHTFLAEEYVPGITLFQWVASNFPFPLSVDTTEYAHHAEKIVNQLRDAVDRIHAAGVALCDLQPRNILVSEDGDIHIIDFETSTRLSSEKRPALGTPGFIPEAECSMLELDNYGLAQTAMHIFSPITPISEITPKVWKSRLQFVQENFPSSSFALLRDLESAIPVRLWKSRTRVVPIAAKQRRWFRDPSASREVLVKGILRSKSEIGLEERPFPGDIGQFQGRGMLNVETGAAGVLLALHRAGCSDGDVGAWLAKRAVLEFRESPWGLLQGKVGMSCVLTEIGYPDTAATVLRGGSELRFGSRDVSLSSGISGIALGLLSMARVSEEIVDPNTLNGAVDAVRRVIECPPDAIKSPSSKNARPCGLMDGWAGIALTCIALGDIREEEFWYEHAVQAIARDLAGCVIASDGSLQVDDVVRMMPYLADGSVGIGIAIAMLPDRYVSSEMFITLERLQRACEARSYANAGLFHGRAGMLVALAAIARRRPQGAVRPSIEVQLDLLANHAFVDPERASVEFAGHECQRLSSDYSTGTAGVLAALNSVHGNCLDWLPVVEPSHLFRLARGGLGETKRLEEVKI